MALISRADAARELGVTPAAVYAAIKAGRLSVTFDAYGKIKVDTTTMREEWARNTQTKIRVGPNRVKKAADEMAKATAEAKEGIEKGRSEIEEATAEAKEIVGRLKEREAGRISRTHESIPDYDESRARTEHLKAELLELDRQQKEGLLVKAADVEHEWVEVITRARTKLLGIPTKAKQRIPDLDTDAIGVLDDIVREALEDLAVEGQ